MGSKFPFPLIPTQVFSFQFPGLLRHHSHFHLNSNCQFLFTFHYRWLDSHPHSYSHQLSRIVSTPMGIAVMCWPLFRIPTEADKLSPEPGFELGSHKVVASNAARLSTVAVGFSRFGRITGTGYYRNSPRFVDLVSAVIYAVLDTSGTADVCSKVDLCIFNMFGWTGAPTKGPPQARQCRTAARHFLHCAVSLRRVATFRSLLNFARHSLACRGALYDVLQSLNFGTLVACLSPEQKTYVKRLKPPHFYRTGPRPNRV